MTVGQLKALLADQPDDKRLACYRRDDVSGSYDLTEFGTHAEDLEVDGFSVAHRHLYAQRQSTVLVLTGV